ncbi:hypothetical protein GMO_24440 [Gluconobacter morbifer G707]|uniref:Uncharacterized protein n=1 Tax=Gluconobacter morbifer G707 TaxID=1088869 RepID=G6XL21_9PROT|nr:hypothetical protein GMO_24440 [Gluconobacter morbifer G707]
MNPMRCAAMFGEGKIITLFSERKADNYQAKFRVHNQNTTIAAKK